MDSVRRRATGGCGLRRGDLPPSSAHGITRHSNRLTAMEKFLELALVADSRRFASSCFSDLRGHRTKPMPSSVFDSAQR